MASASCKPDRAADDGDGLPVVGQLTDQEQSLPYTVGLVVVAVPAAVLAHGLPIALAAVAERSPVPVEVHVENIDRLPEPVEAAAGERLRVEVSDDGIGGAQLSGGSGLQGLRDRVEAIGGRLELHSPPRGGTRITAYLPLEGRRDG
jgi:signal transduction histidine kinase